MALAVAIDCGFAARAFAADTEHLKGLMKEAMNHQGFALIDDLARFGVPVILFSGGDP